MYEMSGSIETSVHYISTLHLVQLFIRVRLIPPVSAKLMACLANNDIYTQTSQTQAHFPSIYGDSFIHLFRITSLCIIYLSTHQPLSGAMETRATATTNRAL